MRRRTSALPAVMCYRLNGTWSCTRDGVTEPCGDCDACRTVAAQRRAESRVDALCPLCASIRILDGSGRLPWHRGLQKEASDPTARKVCRGVGLLVAEAAELAAALRAERLAKDL